MTKARTLADNFAADINGITAGTGITGGGTSGTVTVTNSMATAIDAKGDLVVGTGADTFSRLAVASTAGYLLTVDSAEATGLKWAAPAGGGKVLQVVQANYSTTVNTYSTSYADTGLTASITPSSSSSKVLVIISQGFWVGRNSTNAGLWMQLQRGSTALQTRWVQSEAAQPGGSPVAIASTTTHTYLDSPATTSSTSYKTQFKLVSADIGGWGGAANYQTDSNILLLEIGA